VYLSDQFRLKIGLAEMLKGGVIMDVTTVAQARIAEGAGAAAVMALERVPADIRKEGGVARMASIRIIREIMDTVSIPVMAKARIGHFAEARVLEALGVDYVDESEVLTPADEEHHILKRDFQTPFVCGARNLGEALRSHDPHQGRGRLRQHRRSRAPYADHRQGDEAAHRARQGRIGA
jgi:pyridoxal 5'-phosphate synthase pdxS subunit